MDRSRLHTPSLRVRIIGAGMVTWVVLVLSLDAFVFLSLRTELLGSLDELLETRATLAQELGANLTPEQLDERLTELGIPAVVYAEDGRRLTADPAAPGFGPGPPGPLGPPDTPREALDVELTTGVTVTVFASRAGVERTLRQVLLFEAIGSFAITLLMLVLLLRMSKVLLDPIDQVVVTARRIAAGRSGERLRPDRPGTELGRMAAAFDEMLDSLEEAVELAQAAERDARDAEARSRRFLADAAHQLRTPAAALRALVESLLRTENPDEQQQLLDNLAREATRMGNRVVSLLRVAQLDRGDTPRIEPIDLTAIVADETARARDFAPHLEFLCAESEPLIVDVDADMIREAVANLLDNARRFAARRVRVSVTARPGHVDITVADDGPGLPAGGEERAFERFETLGEQGGTGLGLPIARGIARAHGGEVAYRDRGFVVTLPAATAVTEAAAAPRRNAGDAEAGAIETDAGVPHRPAW